MTPEAPEDLVAVLEQGVRPTCVDAAALHGLWTPLVDGVHAFAPRCVEGDPHGPQLLPIRRRLDPRTGELVLPPEADSRGRPRRRQSLVLHTPSQRAWPDLEPVPDIGRTLDHAARCLDTVDAAILIESALNKHVLDSFALEGLLAGLPHRFGGPLHRVRSDAQSGTETAVRWWFEQRQVSVRTQVQLLPGVRVDILVGTNWVIECDSRTFHDDPDQYREDRRRDLALAALGYRVTRLTWEQVFIDWENTQQMLLAMLRRREHRRPLRA
ncbi:endonuclease domain-containing protein [Brachybacterium sp. ACRRE]|uniref:endonuclease domain-containing protein n=1 Tax=Brachybacterium sp. ACRRE TaxID=2918184 RepID=UPI001EF2310E|nr:endonuclease domain-containing protein [Brachybacterium sp. ACRRE]